MSVQHCPNEGELFRFVDADLSPEQLERLGEHVKRCLACTKQVAALRELIADVAAPSAIGLDIPEHVGSVMARLDEPARPAQRSRLALWGGLLAAAAALGSVLFVQLGQPALPLEQFAARGGAAGSSRESSLSRDVGLQLYAREQTLRPLEAGSRVQLGVALTAGLRNLGSARAYLLLFAIDAEHEVHWIAPEFLTADSDPVAVPIVPSTSERLLATAAVFEDLAPGALRVVALVTREPLRVSQIEALAASELGAERLMKHFPRAEVRQFLLTVSP